MIRRRSLRTRAIKMLVLDEADEMLNKGETDVTEVTTGSCVDLVKQNIVFPNV